MEDAKEQAPLTDQEVLQEFMKMLDDMNLTDEKKAPLLSQSIENKRQLLSTYLRGASAHHTVIKLWPVSITVLCFVMIL